MKIFKDSTGKIIDINDSVVFKPSTKLGSAIQKGKVIRKTDFSIKIKHKSVYGRPQFTNIYNTSENVIIIRKG